MKAKAGAAAKTASEVKTASEMIGALKARFETNSARHEGIDWKSVETRLSANPAKIETLMAMENTGGEPDVVGKDEATGEFLFYDCAPESPAGRRSLCYDRAALDSRKEAKPVNSAMDLASELGGEIVTEEQYGDLQRFGPFDRKTSSWLKTPDSVRFAGGALFGDWRYGRSFTYHNGADSYYGARGFRMLLRV